MKTINASQKVKIPPKVKVTVKGRVVTVTGPRGTLQRSFRHLACDIRVSGRWVIVEVWWGNTKHNASVRTTVSHIKNMMTGVSKGWMYKVRLVFAHFPISANINDERRTIEVENFLGEEKPRIVKIPEGITITCKSRVVTVKHDGNGKSLSRDFSSRPLDIQIKNGHIYVTIWMGNKKQITLARTVCTHIKNMITGVTIGFQYNMRLVYAHFPINTAILEDGKLLEIRNFLGEKVVRRVPMKPGVTIARSDKVKDQLELVGADLEHVALTAAVIHQKCTVKGKDIRKFLDGIYVSQRGKVGDFDF